MGEAKHYIILAVVVMATIYVCRQISFLNSLVFGGPGATTVAGG